ncbi:hypothetical protein AMS68_001592 [Peltaster fructicola]|uniref:SnoaL-like domain-containing protein n=1 Tax=Peltaster fructicola TaxID=286661 RepID=A0A6H0XN62_9PEZI|nr:hypothetical protein AMS68_001592 [Peltaster fructicola]
MAETLARPQLPPPPQEVSLANGVTLVAPITRRGHGPGLIVLVNDASRGIFIKNGVPSPLQKWGEEGYTVVEIATTSPSAISTAVQALRTHEQCQPKGAIGLVAYDDNLWEAIAPQIAAHSEILAAVLYTNAATLDSVQAITIPLLVHASGKSSRKLARTTARLEYDYPAQLPYFASPLTEHFDYATEGVSHTRNLTHLKKLMNGPYFDLEAYWDEHTYYEFEIRDVEATMCTMVQEPYVNHIPTLTGGIGREALTAFYQDHFVFANPADTELELISRTVGIDRVVDEFLFKFTHDRVIDWLFPGIPATSKQVEIPFMAVVNIRGDRLYHEHITWDHASALRQIGWLPESLPYSLPATKASGVDGHHVNGAAHLVLPVAGIDTAKKLRDKNAVESNLMFTATGIRS